MPENGLQLWLRADEGVEVDGDGLVTEWGDQSGMGNDASQRADGNSSELPALIGGQINGQPVVEFDGEDDVLEIANDESLRPGDGNWSVLFVGKRLGGSQGDFPQVIGSRPWTAGLDNGWAVAFGGEGLVGSHYADGSSGHDVPATLSESPLATDAFQLWHVEEDRAAGATRFFVNGDLDATLSTAMPGGAVNQELPVYIGREIGGSNNRRANIQLAEILVYNRALSEEERLQVTQRLSDQYDLGFEQNVVPTARIDSPAESTEVSAPAELTIEASAEDSDGEVVELEILEGEDVLAATAGATLSTTVRIASSGTVSIRARARDDRGGESMSPAVAVTASRETTAPSEPVADGLQLWLKADSGVTADESGFVERWEGQSANSHEAIQDNSFTIEPDDNFKPLLVEDAVNGQPVLRFDGVDDFMQIESAASLEPGSDDWTVIFVAKRLGGSQGDYPQVIGSRPWSAALDEGWAVVFQGASGAVGSHFADGSAGHDVTEALSRAPLSSSSIEVWQVQERRSENETAFFRNGGSDSLLRTAMPTEPVAQIDATFGIFIGSEVEGADSRRANVDLAEALIYNRGLTEQERENVHAYLLSKYGVPGMTTLFEEPSIIAGPEDVTASEGQSVTFSVDAGGESTLFQWQRDGLDIEGAFGPTLSVPEVTSDDDGASYRVKVKNPAGEVTSEPATLTVMADSESPQVRSVQRALFNPREISVQFSEAVSEASALEAGNYSLSNDLTVTGVAASPDRTTVVLSVDEDITEEIAVTLTVQDVTDRFGNTLGDAVDVEVVIPQLAIEYEETFTINDVRTDGLFDDNSDGAYDVEESFDNPAATWTPTSSFSFNTPQSSTDPETLEASTGNEGAASGFAQSGGGDASFRYGLSDHYVIQVDAILPTDRLDITTLPEAGGGIFADQSLSVFFRRDSTAGTSHPAFPETGLPGIGVFNGSTETAVTDSEGEMVLTGVDDDNWHTFAVEVNRASSTLRLMVDGNEITTVDLSSFAGGIYQGFSNGAVGMGGAGGVFWMDNFRVGGLAGTAGPVGPLAIAREGDSTVLTWESDATLERADEVVGPWTAIPQASTPFKPSTDERQSYFRLKK